ncbi:MAG TPA: hypothetical protein VG742_19905 [Dongiaceae bacterium]|nr:hypothetical protein [Dongiaceae bacterium]
MLEEERRVTLRLALDPYSWRAGDKADWAMRLAGATEAAAPQIISVESYEIGDTLIFLRLRTREEPKRLKKLLRNDERFMRLRARLADLDVRPEFEIDENKNDRDRA